MSKKVLILSTSMRGGSNSQVLASAFAKGVVQAGHQVDLIGLRGKSIGFCTGCLACQSTNKCVIEDDMTEIARKMLGADVVVFATPVYFYGMAGQMKTLLDRLNPLFPTDYCFRDIYLIATAADHAAEAMEGVTKGMQGFVDCFEKATLKGVVAGLGLGDANVAEASAHYATALAMGTSV